MYYGEHKLQLHDVRARAGSDPKMPVTKRPQLLPTWEIIAERTELFTNDRGALHVTSGVKGLTSSSAGPCFHSLYGSPACSASLVERSPCIPNYHHMHRTGEFLLGVCLGEQVLTSTSRIWCLWLEPSTTAKTRICSNGFFKSVMERNFWMIRLNS